MKDEKILDFDFAARSDGAQPNFAPHLTVGPVAQRLASLHRPAPASRCRSVVVWLLVATGVVTACLAAVVFQQTKNSRWTHLSSLDTSAAGQAKPIASVLPLAASASLDETTSEPVNPVNLAADDTVDFAAFYVSDAEDKQAADLFLQQLDATIKVGEVKTATALEALSVQGEVVQVDLPNVEQHVDETIGDLDGTGSAELVDKGIEIPAEKPSSHINDMKVDIVAVPADRTDLEVPTHRQDRTEESGEFSDEQISESVAAAIAEYRVSLAAFKKTIDDRAAAQHFYANCAALCSLAQTDDAGVISSELKAIYGDQVLFQFVSSAARSWIYWSQRPSNGVIVAGRVESTLMEEDNPVLQVRTGDKYRSLLSVALEPPGSSVLRAGDTVVLMGIIADVVPSEAEQPKITGRLLPMNSKRGL